jgi:hypothetical protein
VIFLVISRGFLLLVVFEFFGHWRKSDTFWEVRKWVDQFSFFSLTVEERATFTKLALSSFLEVFAGLSLIIGVDST